MKKEIRAKIRTQRDGVKRHVKNARRCINERNYTEAIRNLLWAAQADAFGDGVDRGASMAEGRDG